MQMKDPVCQHVVKMRDHLKQDVDYIIFSQTALIGVQNSPELYNQSSKFALAVLYRVIFLTGSAQKVLSIRLHSKSHQKSSKCQNLLTEKKTF